MYSIQTETEKGFDSKFNSLIRSLSIILFLDFLSLNLSSINCQFRFLFWTLMKNKVLHHELWYSNANYIYKPCRNSSRLHWSGPEHNKVPELQYGYILNPIMFLIIKVKAFFEQLSRGYGALQKWMRKQKYSFTQKLLHFKNRLRVRVRVKYTLCFAAHSRNQYFIIICCIR